MPVNIRLGEAGAGALCRSWRVLRYRFLAFHPSCADSAPAGSGGCPVYRRRDAPPCTPSMLSLPPFSPPLRQPFSLRRLLTVGANSARRRKLPVLPENVGHSGEARGVSP